jgi:hypothetical protein
MKKFSFCPCNVIARRKQERSDSNDVAIQFIKRWIATSVDFLFAKSLREKLCPRNDIVGLGV